MLSDIENMILKCRSENAKTYILEAYSCYNSRNYRSSIVACWIAVAFDLIDKLRELALTGDGTAKEELSKFDEYQSQLDRGNLQALGSALEFERNILETVRDKFELLDQHQYSDIVRLRQDRHRCAHPAFEKSGSLFSPSAEASRMHIVNALNHVLVKAPVQGKAALDSVIATIDSRYFPTELGKAIEALSETEFGRPSAPLIRGFIDEIMFGMHTEDSKHYWRIQSRIALKAARDLYPEKSDPRIITNFMKLFKVCDDKNIPLMIIKLRDFPFLTDQLTTPQKDKFKYYISNGNGKHHPSAVKSAMQIEFLAKSALEAVSKFDAAELVKMYDAHNLDVAVTRAVEIFSTASNWIEVNSAWDNLIVNMVDKLSSVQVAQILKSAKSRTGDLIGSHGFSEFIDKMYLGEGCMTVMEFEQALIDAGLESFIRKPKAENGADETQIVPF